MVEIILPLVRTVFLPTGSPGIGSVNHVMGDLRDVRCGMSGGEVYCFGEADILIDYISCSKRNNLFSSGRDAPTQNAEAQAWQALLSFPFQLSGKGTLPTGSEYHVNLSALEWNMVTARAVELECRLVIAWETEQETSSLDEESMQKDGIQAEKEYISRDRVQKPRETKEIKGGEWQMVTLEEREENKKEAQPEPVQKTGKRNIEIVDLGSEEKESEIHDAIMKALEESASPQKEESLAEKETKEEAVFTISMAFPQIDDKQEETAPLEEVCEEEEIKAMPQEMAGEPDAEMVEEVKGEVEEEAAQEAAAEFIKEVLREDDMWAEEVIPAEHEITLEEMEKELDDVALAMERIETSVEKEMPSVVVHMEEEAEQAEPLTADEVELILPKEDLPIKMVVAETEIVPSPPRKKKRRFGGIPGLYVEAHNNDIDLTAFKINIKL